MKYLTEREIFASASEQSDLALRSAYLDRACEGDPELRARIEQQLNAAQVPVDGPTRTIAPIVEVDDGAGATRTLTHVPRDPAFDETKAPETAESDFDIQSFLAPSQTEGSIGRLDHYEVIGVVGRGGMGVVLQAHDTKLRRVVAIKMLAPALAAVGTARRRFAREAQSAAAVSDQHVVDIHAVCEDRPVPYLVMDFVSGRTLEERIRADGPLPVRDIVRIGMQSARGLAAAHAQGLVHRDVKPGNILLEGGTGQVKLTDFGLARAADDASISRSGVIAGTPLYMSPEQAHGRQIDHRSDLFSLGSVLYTLCTGRPAFRAESTVAVLRRVCKENPRPIREVNPEVPKWVCAVVEKLMAKEPDERIQTTAEVADLFTRYLAHLEDPDRVPPPPAVRGVRVRGRRGWKRPALAALAVVVLIGIGVVAYTFSRPADETPIDRSAPETSWKPRTAEELAKRPSPFDSRTREQIPIGWLAQAGGGDPVRAPAELIAAFGSASFPRPNLALPDNGTGGYPSVSPDGKWLAVPNGPFVRLFDTRTGQIVRSVKPFKFHSFHASFSPDSKLIAVTAGWVEPGQSPESAKLVKVYEVESGKERFTLDGHDGRSIDSAFDTEGKRLATSSTDSVCIWDVATGNRIKRLPVPETGACGVGFSPDGKRLASGSLGGGRVQVWDLDEGKLVRTLSAEIGGDVRMMYNVRTMYSPNGRFILAGGMGGWALWDSQTFQVVHHAAEAASMLAFGADSRTFWTGGGERLARRELPSGQVSVSIPVKGAFTGYCISPDGTTFYSHQHGESHVPLDPENQPFVRVSDVAQAALAGEGKTSSIWAVTTSPDGRTIASGGPDQAVQLWNLTEWKAGEPQPPKRELKGHTATVYSIAYTPDGKLLASASHDGTIRLWNAETGDAVRALQCDKNQNNSNVAFSGDGKLLALGTADGSIRLWDVASGEQQSSLRWHKGSVNSVAFSPDGRFLASGGYDRKVHITDLKTFRRVQTLGPPGDGTAGMGVAFAGDGRTLAFGGWDSTIRLWDLVEKKESVLTGGVPGLNRLAIDPSGRFIASACGGVVRIWNRANPNQPHVFSTGPFGTMPRSLAFTPEGRYLVVGGENGVVSVLKMPAPRSPGDAAIASSAALKQLLAALIAQPASLLTIVESEFARTPLTKADAAVARELLWNAHVANIRKDRAEEMKTHLLKDGDLRMPFSERRFGEKPKEGWSLYISLHGGGGVSKAVGDQQWENQKRLYTLTEGIYLTPRAPIDVWNSWHEVYIGRFFDRLIEDMIAFEGVNPNRVFVLGYGAGGDGVYQIASRLADHWAAAAMMTGHPNKVSPLSLRNVPFTLHVGERDFSYDRNKLAQEFSQSLVALRKNDARGYEHFLQIHSEMDRSYPADAIALPWMAKFSRDPIPERVVWKQVGAVHEKILVPCPDSDRLYWLAVPPGEVKLDSLVIAARAGQTVEIDSVEGVKRLLLRFDDRMVDLDKPIFVRRGGADLVSSIVPRTIEVMIRTLAGRGDPGLIFSAEVEVALPVSAERDPDAILPVNEVEIKRVSALPAAQQIEEVREQLKRRNPGFNGELATRTDKGVVTWLTLSTDHVSDLAPVRFLTQLQFLSINGSSAGTGKVVDLSPLKGLTLARLDAGSNAIQDLSPLEGMPLQHLYLWQWTGTDVRPLKGMPLRWLNIGGGVQKIDLAPIADLPLEFLCINHTMITDLAPIKKMPLTTLLCANTPVADLSPLRGMKIQQLEMYKTLVYDLSPLKGLPIEHLQCEDSKVLDLAPIKELPLKLIRCTFNAKRDSEILRAIKTLETINEKPAAEFWKSLDK